MGISPEAQERIFAPFERERNTTASGVSGAGLGLCLAGSAAGIPSNLVQAAFGAAASTLLALALRRSGYARKRFPGL